MKKFFFTITALLLFTIAHAQTGVTTWGDDFKMKRGSTDLSVIYADKTGVFVKEGHLAMKSYFVIGASTRESATLIKLDKNFAEEYKSDFNKELKGKQFEDFFFIQNKLYLLATDYSKKDRTLTLYAAEVNKADGELSGDWKEVTSWQKEEKGNDLDFVTSYNSDSTKMIVVSTEEGKEKNSYEIREFDAKMKSIGKAVVLTNEFDPKTFQLEDVVYTIDGNIVLVGRIYEFAEGKKKKAKNLEFQNYNVRIYKPDGSLLKEINTDIQAKWLISSKVVQIPNKEIVLAGFYSNAKKGKEINGMLVQRINSLSGEVITTSQKELNTSMISAVDDDGDDDDDKESKTERKEREKLQKIQEDEDGFSRNMRFRNFIYTPDNGIVILAEKYYHYTYTSTSYSGGMGGAALGRSTSTTYDVHECGDIMMSKMDAAGNLTWLHVLPKSQREVITLGSSSSNTGGFNIGVSYFKNVSAYQYPFYAGINSIAVLGKNTVSILFNDNTKNSNVLQLGQKVKQTNRFGKSDCYIVNVDAVTGKYTRTSLFSNSDQPTAMVRLGVPVGKEFYLVGKNAGGGFSRVKIAVGKITFK